MEVHSWFLLAATSLGSTLVLLFFKGFYFRRKFNLPPGPKPWPIIGNLNLIGPLPHVSIHDLSKKYGPLLQLQFGSFPVVVGSSVEMSRQFFKVHDLNFASRPRSSAGKYTNYDHNDLIYASYGPYFRHIRKICVAELFSVKGLDSYAHIRLEETRSFLSNLYNLRGTAITLKDHFSTLTLDNTSTMILGKKYLVGSESMEFRKILAEWELLNGVLNIGDLIPWINFMDLQGYVKRMKALKDSMDCFLERVLDDHIARRHDKDFKQNDLLDVLLQHADDQSSNIKLSRDNVKGVILNFISGGTQTSTTTLEWAMSEVLKHPKILEKAIEELDKVVGRNRWVSEEDIPNLPYLKVIVLESLRLHPVAPMLVPHLAREDCKIEGYDILKGTRILLNVWSIGRDQTLWDKPCEFHPERFLERDIDCNGQNLELLPFGSGRRMCPGYNLGLKLVSSGLANLLHGFTWKLPDQMQPQDLNMDEVFGLAVTKKIPLVVVPEPRLPSHVHIM